MLCELLSGIELDDEADGVPTLNNASHLKYWLGLINLQVMPRPTDYYYRGYILFDLI